MQEATPSPQQVTGRLHQYAAMVAAAVLATETLCRTTIA
jgi:hypothetical protein